MFADQIRQHQKFASFVFLRTSSAISINVHFKSKLINSDNRTSKQNSAGQDYHTRFISWKSKFQQNSMSVIAIFPIFIHPYKVAYVLFALLASRSVPYVGSGVYVSQSEYYLCARIFWIYWDVSCSWLIEWFYTVYTYRRSGHAHLISHPGRPSRPNIKASGAVAWCHIQKMSFFTSHVVRVSCAFEFERLCAIRVWRAV